MGFPNRVPDFIPLAIFSLCMSYLEFLAHVLLQYLFGLLLDFFIVASFWQYLHIMVTVFMDVNIGVLLYYAIKLEYFLKHFFGYGHGRG